MYRRPRVDRAHGPTADPVGIGATADLPDWLNRVHPPPGAEAAVNDAIQVDYEVAGPDQTIRLSVDGVDVTAYADI